MVALVVAARKKKHSDAEITTEMIQAGVAAFYLAVDPPEPFSLTDRLVAEVYAALRGAQMDQEQALQDSYHQVAADY